MSLVLDVPLGAGIQALVPDFKLIPDKKHLLMEDMISAGQSLTLQCVLERRSWLQLAMLRGKTRRKAPSPTETRPHTPSCLPCTYAHVFSEQGKSRHFNVLEPES